MSNNRPIFLSILSWLSFLGEGFGLLIAFLSLGVSGKTQLENASFEINSSGEMPENYSNILNSFIEFWLVRNNHFYLIHISRIALLMISLYGVYLMYKMKLKGFYIYTSTQILLVVIPFVFLIDNPISRIMASLQFFMVGLFVFLYATQTKYLK
mgnify:CR=1 FL=1